MKVDMVLARCVLCFIVLMLTVVVHSKSVSEDEHHPTEILTHPSASKYILFDDIVDNENDSDSDDDEHELAKRRFNQWAGKRSLQQLAQPYLLREQRRFNAWAGKRSARTSLNGEFAKRRFNQWAGK